MNNKKTYSSLKTWQVIEFFKVTKWDTYKLPLFENDITKPNYNNPLAVEGKIMRWH